MENINIYLFRIINNLATNQYINLFFSLSAQYLIFLYLLFIIFIWFYKKQINKKLDNKRIFILSVLSSILSLIINKVLGYIYYEKRPFVSLKHVNLLFKYTPNNSFPSDHMAVVSSIAVMIYIYNKKLGIFLLVISLLIGFSRVFSGVHFPIDIIVGFLSALISALIVYGYREKLNFLTEFLMKISIKLHL